MIGSTLRVLTYHRVLPTLAPSGSRVPAVVSATARTFAAEMKYLARRYRVIGGEDLVHAVRNRRPLPRRAVLVTFDDAYADFGEVAWPILRRNGLVATVFVPTAFPDHPEREFWWDRIGRAMEGARRFHLEVPGLGRLPLDGPESRRTSLRALQDHLKSLHHDEAMALLDDLCRRLGEGGGEAPGVLTWDEIRFLSREGVTMAPHTRTHAALTRISPERARAEIRGAKEDLTRELGTAPPMLAYPFGAHDEGVVSIAREEGIELGFTCVEGHNPLPLSDPLRIQRTGLTSRTTPFLFKVRLQRWAPPVDRWRRARKRPTRVT